MVMHIPCYRWSQTSHYFFLINYLVLCGERELGRKGEGVVDDSEEGREWRGGVEGSWEGLVGVWRVGCVKESDS